MSRDKWELLLAACGWLTFLRLALRVWPFPRIDRLTEPQPAQKAKGDEALSCATRMVAIATRHLPWHPTCLERSLALRRILAKRGIETQLRIGVRKESETLLAHAWLEREGKVLNDSPLAIAPYARLTKSDRVFVTTLQLLRHT